MPNLIVMVGLPGSGKSTLVNKLLIAYPDAFVYSTDQYIEDHATSLGKTYNDVFDNTIKMATSHMNNELAKSIGNRDIIWDQTNMSDKKRKQIISKFGNNYVKTCIAIEPPKNENEENILKTRLSQRFGKIIPEHVIDIMKNQYVEPSRSEGFDKVMIVSMSDSKNIQVK